MSICPHCLSRLPLSGEIGGQTCPACGISWPSAEEVNAWSAETDARNAGTTQGEVDE